MTAGSSYFGDPNPANLGSYRFKEWSGGDGKYTTFEGQPKLKWNDYQVSTGFRSAQAAGTSGVWGNPSFPFPFPDIWPDYKESKLQSKLVSAIKGHEFNLAVNLAQGKQTVNTATNALQSIGRALLYTKRGQFGNAVASLKASPRRKKTFATKEISSRWLELQYAWLPMIGDVYQAAKAYESITAVRSVQIKVNGSYTIPQWEQSAFPTLYKIPGVGRVRRRYIVELTEPYSQFRALGLYDPLSIAWEVIPYSFVVDWFYPIGTYLENLAVLPHLKGRFLRITTGQHMDYVEEKINDVFNIGSSTRYDRSFIMERKVLSGLTTQMPTFRKFPDAMSPRRIFSAIALIHQRLS